MALYYPSTIIDVVESYYGLMKGSTLENTRTKTIVEARSTAMYLCRVYAERSYSEIANIFYKDHSTVMHSCKKINKMSHRLNDIIQLLHQEA